VNSCLLSDSVLPSSRRDKKIIPGWFTFVKPYKENNSFWYNIWKSCGKPRTGHLFEYMREARRQYLYAIRRVKRNELVHRNERLASAIAQDKSRDFFAEIKRLNPRPKYNHGVNGTTNAQEIADIFREKYSKLYNCVPSAAENLRRIENYISQGIRHSSSHESEVTKASVKSAIDKLKHNKSDGDQGFISSHLIYAGEEHHKQVAAMFSCMMTHGYHPERMLVGTIISIPKDYREDLAVDDNYRGIALSNSLTKLLDLVLLERNCVSLVTSALQFAYKKHISTTMCTLIMKEVVKDYMNNKSVVFSCCMDASTAFDRLRHDKLFLLLIDKCLPALDLRILFQQYKCQKLRTSWQDKTSDYFRASKGSDKVALHPRSCFAFTWISF
jgi:hypothetical protein